MTIKSRRKHSPAFKAKVALGSLCITRFQASQCLNEREVRSPLPLKKPAK